MRRTFSADRSSMQLRERKTPSVYPSSRLSVAKGLLCSSLLSQAAARLPRRRAGHATRATPHLRLGVSYRLRLGLKLTSGRTYYVFNEHLITRARICRSVDWLLAVRVCILLRDSHRCYYGNYGSWVPDFPFVNMPAWLKLIVFPMQWALFDKLVLARRENFASGFEAVFVYASSTGEALQHLSDYVNCFCALIREFHPPYKVK
jgi:hypothetical protein